MDAAPLRRLLAALTCTLVLGACTIEQDLTPRVDGIAGATADAAQSSDATESSSAGSDTDGAGTTDETDESGEVLADDSSPQPNADTEGSTADDGNAGATDDGSTNDGSTTDNDSTGGTTGGGATDNDSTGGGPDDSGGTDDGGTTTDDPAPQPPSPPPSPVPGNRPPVANDDDRSTAEDQDLVAAVTDNDSDPDKDALTVTSVGSARNGTTSTNGSTVTYRPAADFNGTDQFTYTISDGRGGSDTATVDVTVRPVNDAPVASDDSGYLVQAFKSLTLTGMLDNDSDVDGDPLSAVLDASSPLYGGATQRTSTSFTYTHKQGCQMTAYGRVCPQFDEVDYRASDGTATSGLASIRVAINYAPRVGDDVMVLDGSSGDCNNASLFFNPVAGQRVASSCWSTSQSSTFREDVDDNGDTIEYDSPLTPTLEPWMSYFQCSSSGLCQVTVKNANCAAATINYTVRDNRGGFGTGTMTFQSDFCLR